MHGLLVADLTGFTRSQHRVQLVELQLFQVQRAEEIRREGAQVLGRFDSPLQHGGGGDLKDPRRGADTQALGQAGQDMDNQLHRHLFAMKDGAMMLWKVPFAGSTVELTPLTPAGMAVGAQVTKP